MNRILKIAFTAIAVAFLAWGGLNTSGFCFAEMRYVPEKEFFARYLESQGTYVNPQLFQIRDWTNNPDIKSFTTYLDGADFIARNPDCCSYGPQAGVSPESDLSGPSISQMFFGLVWGTVAVRHSLQYMDSSGKPKALATFMQQWVDPCGYHVRRY